MVVTIEWVGEKKGNVGILFDGIQINKNRKLIVLQLLVPINKDRNEHDAMLLVVNNSNENVVVKMKTNKPSWVNVTPNKFVLKPKDSRKFQDILKEILFCLIN